MILAAGYGTRMLPITKSQPKEMLPLIDKPVIQYSVEEAVASGIEEIILVTAIGKQAVEDYFDRSRDVEDLLQKKGDEERLDEIRRISELAQFAYVRQREQRGLGDAVMTAKHLIGDDPFVLILPDDVIIGEPPATRQLIDSFRRNHASVVAVQEVPDSETSSYGIVVGEPVSESEMKLSKLVEKPAAGTSPSNLAIVGRYLFTPTVFDAIARTSEGYGGEIQITDAMQILAQEEGLYSMQFTGTRYDTGRPLSLLTASIAMGLSRPDTKDELRAYLKRLDL